VSINSATGAPADNPKRITQWAGSSIEQLSARVDGKRLMPLKTMYNDACLKMLQAPLRVDENKYSLAVRGPGTGYIPEFVIRQPPGCTQARATCCQITHINLSEPVATAPYGALFARATPDGA